MQTDHNRRSFLRSALTISAGASVSAFAVSSLSTPALASGWLDGRDLGLVPNLTKDQSAHLQKAMNKAAKAGRPLFLPGGLYLVRNLDIPSGLHLIGHREQSQLVMLEGARHLVRIKGQRSITFENITFRGDGPLGVSSIPALILAEQSDKLNFQSCTIREGSQSGLMLEGCSGRIEDCSFSDLGLYAIFSRHARGLWIEGNKIEAIGNGGILVHRGSHGHDGSRVLNNQISKIDNTKGGSGQFGNGINIYRADNVLVSGNLVRNCAYSAIRANGANQCQIVQNHCLGSGEIALYSEFDFDGAVIANNILEGGTNGISVANFMQGGRRVTVSGNLIHAMTNPTPHKGPQLNNFGLYVEADAVVTGNNIEDCPAMGMVAGFGPYLRNIVMGDNLVRGSEVGLAVSVVEKAGTAHIHNNLFEGSQVAIAGYRWHDRTTKELLGHPDRAPSNIHLRNNQTA
ncbi:MAG: TIGR03808 family TAT-translocated repetitive protein [Cohaesibacter sp.]|jgi:uncharacterized secreted repeat protein (TIGR03808 family)|nr:TIGR03808 family TAT-translocated repetitive protein [Cohaesibacter sp.]